MRHACCGDIEQRGRVVGRFGPPVFRLECIELAKQTIQCVQLGARQMGGIQKLVEPGAPVTRRQDRSASALGQAGRHHRRNVCDLLSQEHQFVRAPGLKPGTWRVF
jgi:hypothetical protein